MKLIPLNVIYEILAECLEGWLLDELIETLAAVLYESGEVTLASYGLILLKIFVLFLFKKFKFRAD